MSKKKITGKPVKNKAMKEGGAQEEKGDAVSKNRAKAKKQFGSKYGK